MEADSRKNTGRLQREKWHTAEIIDADLRQNTVEEENRKYNKNFR